MKCAHFFLFLSLFQKGKETFAFLLALLFKLSSTRKATHSKQHAMGGDLAPQAMVATQVREEEEKEERKRR
jgi:hypothetical protein